MQYEKNTVMKRAVSLASLIAIQALLIQALMRASVPDSSGMIALNGAGRRKGRGKRER